MEHLNRQTRMTAQEALDHPWIKEAGTRMIDQLYQEEMQRNYAIGALISLDKFGEFPKADKLDASIHSSHKQDM